MQKRRQRMGQLKAVKDAVKAAVKEAVKQSNEGDISAGADGDAVMKALRVPVRCERGCGGGRRL
jgi:hypothetical protein